MTCRTGVFAAPTEKGCCSIPPMLQGVIGPGIVALAPHAQAHGTKSRPLAIVAVKAEDGQERDERSGRSRRGILLASAAAVLVASSGVEDEAAAFSLGICKMIKRLFHASFFLSEALLGLCVIIMQCL